MPWRACLDRSEDAPAAVAELAAELAAITTRPWTLMEVCGGQTHAILRWGLDQLLPPGMRLIHGPGCPVCVTPAASLDAAVALARRPEVILASYGDMLRVPGSEGVSLLQARAEGADVRLITSAPQALDLALEHPRRQVVLLAVGFETTAPATALLARRALDLGLSNLTILSAHVRVAPAMAALLEPTGAGIAAGDGGAGAASPVQGFLAAGHVCAVIGTGELRALVARHRLPVVVSGFEPEDLLRGVLTCVRQLEAGEPRLLNAYPRVVRPEGNAAARALLEEVFEVVDRPWRGLGVITAGGLDLRGPYAALDARRRFALADAAVSGDGVPAAREAHRAGGRIGEANGGGHGDQGDPRAALPGRALGLTPRGDGIDPRLPVDPQAAPASASGEGSAFAERSSSRAGGGGASPAACTRCAPSVFPSASSPAAAAPAPSGAAAAGAGATAADPCIAGRILRGLALPSHCDAFGTVCTPEHPLGAPMVSSEGACAAYHRYRGSEACR